MTNNEKVNEFLQSAGVFYLSTVDGDTPKTRPLGLAKLINDKIYMAVGDFKNVYKELLKNPKCEVVACKEMNWIRISGKAIFESDFEIANKLMEGSPDLKALYEKNGWKSMAFHIEGKCQFIEIMTVKEELEI